MLLAVCECVCEWMNVRKIIKGFEQNSYKCSPFSINTAQVESTKQRKTCHDFISYQHYVANNFMLWWEIAA